MIPDRASFTHDAGVDRELFTQRRMHFIVFIMLLVSYNALVSIEKIMVPSEMHKYQTESNHF